MTLSKQLIIITSILLTILFIGTLMLSINNMREYLAQQLESHAQDTASSLGLSLTPHIKTNDLPIMNSMIDAIFDRGYYLEINLVTIDGKKIIERKNNEKVEGVPAWFVKAIPLQTPQGKTTISNGWKQAAHVYVRSHPGYAYVKLWSNTVETFGWFVLSFSVAITGFIMALKFILQPLKRIENMALSITRREFPTLKTIPKTKELKSVVAAMNKMSAKVKNMLLEQTNTIKRAQEEAYTDKVTGLANRRSFDMQLDHVNTSAEETSNSLLLFVRIKDLQKLNNEKGFQQGDAIIRHVADVINTNIKSYHQAFVARIAGGEFGVIINSISLEDSTELAETIAYQIPLINILRSEIDVCHLGGVCYQGKVDKKELLAKADLALQVSLLKTPNCSIIYGIEKDTSRLNIHINPDVNQGAQQWSKMLKQGMEDNKFVFFQQPVISLHTDKIDHYEIHSKLLDEKDELISAMDFIPMAEKMGIMSTLDKHIVETFIEYLKNENTIESIDYSLNISASSFHDADFIAWLYEKLKAEKEIAKQLILETSEYVVHSETEIFKQIVNDFQSLGCRFSLDHFGTAYKPFGYLHDLKINFIKVHGALVRGVAYNKDNRFFIQSLCQIAHGLDIQVIAEFVENEEDLIVLNQLGVDAAQGFYLGKVIKLQS
ncbi:MAG: EAL domain-containing protein [Gammaproteobacteria bacterium]|nr:EAL domain-containing protein [Gammaproteobacteria bacterium]